MTLTFMPLLPLSILSLLLILGGLACLYPLRAFWRGGVWRLCAVVVLILCLANPHWDQYSTVALNDQALVIIDDSPSQSIANRPAQIDRALEQLGDSAATVANLTLKTVRLSELNRQVDQPSALGPALHSALSEIPPSQYAGTLLITDGQLSDPERISALLPKTAPFHVLLTGQQGEIDRRLDLLDTPKYSIVDQAFSVRFRVLDNGHFNPDAAFTITDQHGTVYDNIFLNDAKDAYVLTLTPEQVGETSLIFQTPALDQEITPDNNIASLTFNAVHERLRVLLVSGLPHQGQRTWRNLLKADPAVDLVQFTILRPARKDDYTPLNELSLISFPVHELFEDKLYDFDLIIFDRYQKHNILGAHYFNNIKRYVELGGAVFIASGPNFAGPESLAYSPLGPLLPAQPTGLVLDQTPYRIAPTTLGQRHPITASLNAEHAIANWGRWLRYIPVEGITGDVLLQTDNQQPLLIVNRVEKGRIAQLQSDHLWLWARQFDGGGPHQSLMRNTIHWLMRDPALEENRVILTPKGTSEMTVTYQSTDPTPPALRITHPDGTQHDLRFAAQENSMTFQTPQAGLYHLHHGDQTTTFAQGPFNDPEFHALRRRDDLIRPIVIERNGTIVDLSQTKVSLKQQTDTHRYYGPDWVRFKANNDYRTDGITQSPLLPLWVYILAALGFWGFGWGRDNT